MAGGYRRGFKKQAEDLALAIRQEMGLRFDEQLDPRSLAEHVGVPVFDVEDLLAFGMPKKSVRHLLGAGRKEFSAALFERSGRRLIVANSKHSINRQASNIVHEVAHLRLEHKPPTTLIEAGCRRWNPTMEREADWLAGELLVPRQAALSIARSGGDVESSALRYGVSKAMMTWRLNNSGALKQARHEMAARRRRAQNH